MANNNPSSQQTSTESTQPHTSFTSTKAIDEPSPNKNEQKRKLDELTKQMSDIAIPIDKATSFEFLCVMSLLEIRYDDLSQFKAHIAIAKEFKQILKDINHFCVISTETPISSSSIEAILIDRFETEFKIYSSSFKYLIKSYQRCLEFKERINRYWTAIIPQKDQIQIVSNIEQCILTFCGILLSTPVSTTEDFLKSQQEFQWILSSPPKGRDFPKGFLQRLFEQIEDDSMCDVLDKVMDLIKNTSLNVLRSNFGAAINCLIKLSQLERVALFIMDRNKAFWIPNEKDNDIMRMKSYKVNANIIIRESVLGGLLNLSFETNDIKGLFNGLSTDNTDNNNTMNIKTSFQEYRLIMNELQNGIYTVFNNFVRIKNKQSRENVLRLLSYFIYINLDRGKMRFDHKNVSSDGFMLNLNYILLKLCDPIIKRNMLNKIDSNYFLIKKNGNYMSWDDTTRLNADNHQIKVLQNKLYNDTESKSNEDISFGFTTQIFCLTLESLHLGFSCVYNEVSRLQIHIDRLKREARANPMAGFMINITVQRLEKQLLSQIAHLMEQRFMLMLGEFYGFFCKYLLYLSSNKEKGKELLSIIPEYFIEDMSRFFRLFLTERGFIMLIQRGQSPFNREEVMKCLIYLMSADTPIRNIYQRACLCEVLLYFLPHKVLQSKNNPNIKWNEYEYSNHEFNRFDSCRSHLVSTLLILYSDVERTGSPGQYYEKFKFRTIITRILKFLFSYNIHQNNLVKFWETQKDSFIAFLNMLINDLIYTLDHGFDGLTEIRQIETETETNTNSDNTNNNWNPLDPFGAQPQNEAMQRQENVSQIKDTIRHYMNLANESIQLLQYVCDHCIDPFMDHLILPRIAVLVSVYLDRLANGSELRVKGNLREDYNFNAKFLLTSVVNIFNKLCEDNSNRELFLDAIVEDEAHFRAKSYEKGINVLRKKSLMNLNEVSLFEAKLGILIKKFEEKKNIECILGDIPSKYLDPIMQTLMTDPVILKSKDKNKYIMDRKVIERHLMNNPNNPFNREPLNKEDLIPHKDLKKEIDEWKTNTIQNYRNNEEHKQQ